jgi:flagellar basal body rod protein FlgG
MSLGIYIAGSSGQMAQRKLNDIAHNLANVNTAGFLADRSSFTTHLAKQIEGQAAENTPSFSKFGNQFIDMQEGSIQTTGNVLDFAIQGGGFFRVALPDGSEAYTRAGNFKLNANGSLLTQSGYSVLDASGNAIQLKPGQISADTSGGLSVDGSKVAQFGLVTILDGAKVEKFGETLMKTPISNTESASPDITVHQGSLQGSNVNAILAMTEMIDTMRSYQATMKVVEQFNQQAAQLSDKVGRIQG